MMTRSANDRRCNKSQPFDLKPEQHWIEEFGKVRLTKNSPWSIVTSETGFTHARAEHSQSLIPNPNVCCLLGLSPMPKPIARTEAEGFICRARG